MPVTYNSTWDEISQALIEANKTYQNSETEPARAALQIKSHLESIEEQKGLATLQSASSKAARHLSYFTFALVLATAALVFVGGMNYYSSKGQTAAIIHLQESLDKVSAAVARLPAIADALTKAKEPVSRNQQRAVGRN